MPSKPSMIRAVDVSVSGGMVKFKENNGDTTTVQMSQGMLEQLHLKVALFIAKQMAMPQGFRR